MQLQAATSRRDFYLWSSRCTLYTENMHICAITSQVDTMNMFHCTQSVKIQLHFEILNERITPHCDIIWSCLCFVSYSSVTSPRSWSGGFDT